jgi:major vault protein
MNIGNNPVNERDLVLDPSAFAYVQDRSQGEVGIYVGPFKVSLGETDQPVIFDPKQKRFVATSLEQAIQSRVIAPEGWYIIMKNPSMQTDGSLRSPPVGKNASKDVDLVVGRKINIPGPANFALWPGQMTVTVQGHHLRSNQYLLVRVYDEEQASANRNQAVIKSADGTEEEVRSLIPEDLSIGKLFIIKGTDASFFIPPTGIEVVKDDAGNYIRDAETLEVLEYCIILDENGNKRLPRGPAVVFPEPTESFVTKQGHRKFTAFELNEKSGLYIKVIKEYEEDGTTHPVGEELFITGSDTPVYFPREEHAIIKYGENKKIQHSVAIPSGEGRYVLNRKTGEIRTNKGPAMLLPDPRTEVLVRRILNPKEVELMYPGNKEAATVNEQLNLVREANQGYALVASAASADSLGEKLVYGASHASGPVTRSKRKKAMRDFAGDEIARGVSFTPPRTITIDNKYDGVVTVNVWTGFAVNVVKKDGTRRVVTGPNTVMLDYDETLESFSLSKGTPKTQENKKQDVYLRCTNNRVTDQVRVQTKDLVDVLLTLSYRVNFTGNPSKWFEVDDYVALLTDHMRSVLRNQFQQHGIEELWSNKIDMVRDCVLGAQIDGERAGRVFEQNGMSIVDVDFIDAVIQDAQISALLVDAQHESVRLALDVESQRRTLDSFVELETLKRARADAAEETAIKTAALNTASTQRAHDLTMTRLAAAADEAERKHRDDVDRQSFLNEVHENELKRVRAKTDLETQVQLERQTLRLAELEANTVAEERRIKAVTPDLIAAMQVMGQSEFAAKITEELSPLAILGGESVAEVAARLLGGLGLDKVLETLPNTPAKKNGDYSQDKSTTV